MRPECEEPPQAFGTHAPTCDRCGHFPHGGFVLSRKTLKVVCTTCLTRDETARLRAGEDPFEDK